MAASSSGVRGLGERERLPRAEREASHVGGAEVGDGSEAGAGEPPKDRLERLELRLTTPHALHGVVHDMASDPVSEFRLEDSDGETQVHAASAGEAPLPVTSQAACPGPMRWVRYLIDARLGGEKPSSHRDTVFLLTLSSRARASCDRFNSPRHSRMRSPIELSPIPCGYT